MDGGAKTRQSAGRGQDRILYHMRALGRNDLPARFELAGMRWTHEQTVKHDFFAATGFYRAADGRRAVLKVGRVQDFGGAPLDWIGRFLCAREADFYRRLQDVPNIPRFLGTVGPTGLVHEYIEGKPLSREARISDAFFDELAELIAAIHARGIAYVDLNKPENILLGEDGRPYLIDFQISWRGSAAWWNVVNRWILATFQSADLHHLMKHKRRLRPDLMTAEQIAASRRASPLIRLHRAISKPYFLLRRRTLGRLHRTGRLLPEGSK